MNPLRSRRITGYARQGKSASASKDADKPMDNAKEAFCRYANKHDRDFRKICGVFEPRGFSQQRAGGFRQ